MSRELLWDQPAPCRTCPYRRDVPVGFWDASEFRKLLEHDGDRCAGAVFLCHQDRKKPDGEQHPCAGWLIDQKRRGVPCIPLRMNLMRTPAAVACFEAAAERPEVPLYRSIAEMCAVNIGAPPPRNRRTATVTTNEDATSLDAAIIDLLGAQGPMPFRALQPRLGHSVHFTVDCRLLDRRLQALRRAGKISYNTKNGWSVRAASAREEARR